MFNINLERAWEILAENCGVLTGERIPLRQAMGRILQQPIYAPHDMPSRAQSAVDGYALGEGPASAGSSYRLIAELRLDSNPDFSLEYGQAALVQTGGILPPGAWAVVPGEKAHRTGSRIAVQEAIRPGMNIKTAGEDFSSNELLLPAGFPLDYAAMALLSAYGLAEVEAVRKPEAAIVLLAENIAAGGVALQKGQVRDSNGPMLSVLIDGDGGIVNTLVYGGNTAQETLIYQLQDMMGRLDLLVFCGGTFNNGANNLEEIMRALKARVLYQGVELQPGSHTGAALKDSCMLFWLSGNPSACAVNYHLFVKPAIKKLLGQESGYQIIRACCVNGFHKKSNSRRMVRGRLWWTETGWKVEVLPGQKPSMLRSLLNCNAFIDLPAGTPPIEAGQEVAVLPLFPLTSLNAIHV